MGRRRAPRLPGVKLSCANEVGGGGGGWGPTCLDCYRDTICALKSIKTVAYVQNDSASENSVQVDDRTEEKQTQPKFMLSSPVFFFGLFAFLFCFFFLCVCVCVRQREGESVSGVCGVCSVM